MKTFFTSDQHFSHANVIKYCNRPYSSAEEMDEALITNYNSVVKSNDKVWFIGDVFFCDAVKAKSILSRLNGRKHLILGNHDKMIRNQKPVQDLFERVYPDLYEESIDGIKVVMCHYPLLTWNKAHYGSFMLHGHSHGTTKYPFKGRIMDVGVDANNYYPVSWDDIKSKMSEIPFGFKDDQHSRE
jgi:calcineurin-like phosphoesterase family protein